MDDIEILLLRQKLATHEIRLCQFQLNARLARSDESRDTYKKLVERELADAKFARLELEARYRIQIETARVGNGHDYVAEEGTPDG